MVRRRCHGLRREGRRRLSSCCLRKAPSRTPSMTLKRRCHWPWREGINRSSSCWNRPPLLVLEYNNFDREGSGGADVYILCLEEFSSVGMLPPGGSSVFWMLPPRTFTFQGTRCRRQEWLDRKLPTHCVVLCSDLVGFARTTKCDHSFWDPKHAAKYYDVCENPWARYECL